MANNPKLKLLATCVCFVFIWGLIAHAYGFLNSIFSHDTLNAIVATQREELWKIQLGRFLVPIYRQVVRPALAMPWLIGVLSLFYLSLGSFLICDLLTIKSRIAILLISGILATNLTVTALTATYIYELDLDMLALLLSIGAVYIWRRFRIGFLAGAVLTMLSFGLYQAYVTVIISLVMICLMIDLLDGREIKSIVFNGIKAIAMLLLGGGIYACAVKAACLIAHTELSSSQNSVMTLFKKSQTPIYRWVLMAYKHYGKKVNRMVSVYPQYVEMAFNTVFALSGLYCLIQVIRINNHKKLICAGLALMLLLYPLGSDIVYILSHGNVHDLMVFSFVFIYIFLIALLVRNNGNQYTKFCRNAVYLLVFLLLWGNVQTSNAIYLKKDLDAASALSLMTRVVDRIESSDGYKPGETPVAFIGNYAQLPIEGFDEYTEATGAKSSAAVLGVNSNNAYNTYKSYIKYILNAKMNFVDDVEWDRLLDDETLKSMPAFPDKNCIRMVDGVLVVNMGTGRKEE